MVEVTVKEAIRLAEKAWDIGKVPFFWGPPGVGKSAAFQQAAASRGKEFVDVRCTMTNPVDHMGYPFMDEGRAKFTPPFYWRDGKAVILFDELNSSVPATQAITYRIIHDRTDGMGRKLDDTIDLAAAGNNITDRGVVYRMPSPLANRFCHIDVIPDLDTWIEWALGAGLRPEVMSFLRWKPDLLHSFNPERDTKAFPTPRTWHMVASLLEKKKGSDFFQLASMCVGEGAGGEFNAFLACEKDLPDVKVILDGKKAPVPKEPSILHLLIGKLIHEMKKADNQQVSNILKYSYGFHSDEFALYLVKDTFAAGLQRKVTSAKEFGNWVKRYKFILDA